MEAVLLAGLCIFAGICAVVCGCSLRASWRHAIPTAAPLALAVMAFGASASLFTMHPGALREWLVGGFAFGSWPPALAWSVTLAVAAGYLAFIFEKWLLGRPRRRRSAPGALPAQLMAADLPTRAATMDLVGITARKPIRYWGISSLTVAGEELFFRVAAPGVLLASGETVAIAILVPAGLYAVNHLGFGVRTVLAKGLLGVAWGIAAWVGGALPATVLAHLVYQGLVRRQFIPKKRKESFHAV